MTTATIPGRAWVEQIMGLPISIHLRGPAPAAAPLKRAVAAVFADLRHVDAVLSPYREDSDLSRWERRELDLASADPALAEVLALCEQATERTDGRFDPRRLPDPHTGEPRYDPSGLVKGWAAERAARHLAALDDYGWCLNAGGDVLSHAPSDRRVAAFHRSWYNPPGCPFNRLDSIGDHDNRQARLRAPVASTDFRRRVRAGPATRCWHLAAPTGSSWEMLSDGGRGFAPSPAP